VNPFLAPIWVRVQLEELGRRLSQEDLTQHKGCAGGPRRMALLLARALRRLADRLEPSPPEG
jgi:hypothetical protein